MKYFIFLFFNIFLYAQNIVSGHVQSESNFILQDVMVVNVNKGNKGFTNNEGIFKIEADINDELRFLKENFERQSKVIQNKDFITPISIQLVRVPIEIEEVEVVAKLTGNLEKDSKIFSPSEKVVTLNNEIREYVKKPMLEVQPKNSIPSSFAPKDPYEGQVNLLSVSIGGDSGGVIGLLLKQGVKKK